MFRTLLRTLPSLSGNVKLNVNLERTNNINNKKIITKVNKAFLTTASQDVTSFVYNINLLNSRWDYDLRDFYSFYSDQFYKSSFSFIKSDINLIDKYNTVKPRDIDYEFGVSRLSYNVYSNQYSFYAPIYVDNVFDIPNQFEIELGYTYKGKEVIKTIIVPLRPENYIGLYENDNLLYNYLYRYVKNIDQKIIHISNKKIKYYGIDLLKGGFNEYTSVSIAKQVFNYINPLQKTDSLITSGFKESKLCVKQIIPITFNFNINDLFDSVEAARLAFSVVNFKGSYKYTDNIHQELKNTALPKFDFDINVDELYLTENYVDKKTLSINSNKNSNNILDQGFPGLHDAKFYKYQFSNRISPNYTRWRIQKSNKTSESVFDNINYLINFSAVFNSDLNNYFNIINTNNKIVNVNGICNLIKYDESTNVTIPFDSDFDTVSDNSSIQSIDIVNLLLPYNKVYYSYSYILNDKAIIYDYKYSDYYKIINGNINYNNYINNHNSFLYDHFNNIYLSSEYLEKVVDKENNLRIIDTLGKYSYTDNFNLSYIIDDCSYNDLYSDINDSASIFDESNTKYNSLWHTPVNDTVFYNGVLYDLKDIYNTNSSYTKYINTLNDDKYEKIAYKNHILDYLINKDYASWLKTQKITKFGVFNLPIPCIELNDSYLNTAAISLFYTDTDGDNMVNYKNMFKSLITPSNTITYVPVYDDTSNTKNTITSYNISVIRTNQTLKDIDLAYGTNNLYIDAEEFLNYSVLDAAKDNNYYIGNEYIITDTIFDNVQEVIKECHEDAIQNCNFLNRVILPIEASMGVHGLINGSNSTITLEKIKEFLYNNESYKKSFTLYTNIDNINDLNVKIFNCIYDLLIYYYKNINSSNIPVCLMDDSDLKTLFEKVFYSNVTTKQENVNIFINKFNLISGINTSTVCKDTVQFALENLYIKQYGSENLIPIDYNNYINTFASTTNLDINNAALVFKGDVVLKSEFNAKCDKIIFSFNNRSINNNIINALDTRFILNEDLIKIIRGIYDWLVDNNCNILNAVLNYSNDNKSKNTTEYSTWLNKTEYKNNIDEYINYSSAKISNLSFKVEKNKNNDDGYTCLDYINSLYIDAFYASKLNSNCNTSFLLLSDLVKDQVNNKHTYKYVPILLNNSGVEVARNIFIPKNDGFYNEDGILWIDKFNLNKLGKNFFKDGFIDDYSKTLYSLFISQAHLKNYMQYISADADGKYTYKSGNSKRTYQYYQWINLGISSTEGGPFESLYVVENKIVYNSEKKTYESLNHYIPIYNYIIKAVKAHIEDINHDNLSTIINNRFTDPEQRSAKYQEVINAALNILKEQVFDNFTLFNFINSLTFNSSNFTFNFSNYICEKVTVNNISGLDIIDIYVGVDNTGKNKPVTIKFLLAQRSEFYPVTQEILVKEWKLFNSDGNVINYTYQALNNIDFYFYYLYPRETLDSNLSDCENQLDFINFNDEEYNKYDGDEWSSIGVLYPLFNTYKTESLTSTKLYSETTLSNIRSFNYEDNYLFKEGNNLLFKYVTNNSLNTIILLNKNFCQLINNFLTENKTKGLNIDTSKLLNLTVYKTIDINNILINNIPHDGNKYDELSLFNSNNIYTYYKDGENYGFYINFIKANQHIISSLYKFNSALTYDASTNTISGNYSHESTFLAIDNISLVEFKDKAIRLNVKGAKYMCSKITDLLYFNKNIIFNITNNINTLRLPNTYSLINKLEAAKLSTHSVLNNINEYNIVITNKSNTTDIIRYAKYIEPNFKEVYNNIDYVYNLKFKEDNTNLLKNYIYNSIGDTPIYKCDVANEVRIFGDTYPVKAMFDSEEEYNNVVNEYNSNIYYNNIIKRLTPYEYKNFNSNHYYILPQKITFPLNKKYTYNEIINIDNTNMRLERFIQYCQGVYNINNRSEILFLFNRYSSRLEFVADGLDEYKKNKIYSGKFIFTLN